MSKVRKAHSVEIIDRRLKNAEAGLDDALELVGIYDELARVERKWLQKSAEYADGREATRPLADVGPINHRFERLQRLVQAALRRPAPDSPERQLLSQTAGALKSRTPLPDPLQKSS